MDRNSILKKLKSNPSYIQDLNEVDEELNLFIVNNNGNNVKYIKNPSKEVQKEAIKNVPLSVQYIEKIDEEIGIISVKSLWNSLGLIKNPTEEIIKEAIKTKGWAIQFVKDPSEELQVLAVEKDYDAIKYIKNPSENVQLKAINNYYTAIRFIENPTLKAKIEAIRLNGEAINYISNYDLDEIKIFISENINVVKYIYESIDIDIVVEVLINKVKDDNIEKKYMKNFLDLEILEMNKINFVREYGSKKAKKLLVDYKLSI